MRRAVGYVLPRFFVTYDKSKMSTRQSPVGSAAGLNVASPHRLPKLAFTRLTSAVLTIPSSFKSGSATVLMSRGRLHVSPQSDDELNRICPRCERPLPVNAV